MAAELSPTILCPASPVRAIKEEFGFLRWTVETDKGPKEFVMRHSVVHYAREIGPNHWLVIDVGQARYEIRISPASTPAANASFAAILYL